MKIKNQIADQQAFGKQWWVKQIDKLVKKDYTLMFIRDTTQKGEFFMELSKKEGKGETKRIEIENIEGVVPLGNL